MFPQNMIVIWLPVRQTETTNTDIVFSYAFDIHTSRTDEYTQLLLEHTFIGLRVGNLQIEISIFTDLFLMKYCFLQILYGYVKTVESDRVIGNSRFELVMDRHDWADCTSLFV